MSQFTLTEDRVRELSQSVRTLALIGAGLKTLRNANVTPEVARAIGEAVRSVFGESLETLSESSRSTISELVAMSFAESHELLNNPERPIRWHVDDPVLLQTQGRASAQVFRRICALADHRSLLMETLQGRFLDVGTGVGGIALEAARRCPNLEVDGIDIWDPALTLAQQNIRESPYAGRITIRKLDVTELPETPQYSLVWLPTMFMKREVVIRALDRITATLLKNAYVVAGHYTIPSPPEAAAFATLRTIRSGGEPFGRLEMEDMFRCRGLVDIESDVHSFATFTIGRMR
jgi:SAM-dependent methyltransferase